MKYVRANRLGRVRWGVLDGDVIRTLKWPPYDGAEYYDGTASFWPPATPARSSA